MADIDFTPLGLKIGNFALGKASYKITFDVRPSGNVDFVQTGEQPIRVIGTVGYDISIQLGGAGVSSSCKQDWFFELKDEDIKFAPKPATNFH